MSADEFRLDALRREAAATGRVAGAGVAPPDGPMPAEGAGYHGRPVLKAPPWTWEVPVYLFVGGLAGASAVLALAGRAATAGPDLVRAALWIAVWGAASSAALLVSDLGRPRRFLHMLRVFKWRSPMSVGVWLLTAFGPAAAAALALDYLLTAGLWWLAAPSWLALAAAALTGSLLATYTGVLLAATALPVWNTQAAVLPVHFGVAALGSAAGALELIGYRLEALHVLGYMAALLETGLAAWSELGVRGRRSDPLRSGRSGTLLRAAGVLAGPVSLVFRLAGLRALAAAAFLAGALIARFGWMAAGRASAQDPEAVLR